MNRTLLTRETGHVVFDADGTPATFFAEGSISLELGEETVELPSMMFGVLDKIPVGRMVKLKYIPQEFSVGAVEALFPQGALQLGDSLFGASDKTIDIHTVSGNKIRMACCAVYQEPEIRGDIKKTVFGEVEWWGVLGISADPNALASFVAESSVSYPGAAGFDQTAAITPAWSCSWGASPFDAIVLNEGGFSLKTKAKPVEDKPMGFGLVNVALADYSIEISFEPMGISRAQLMARMGYDVALGGRKSAAASPFIAQGTGIYLAASGMYLDKADPFQFDSEKRTTGKVTLKSTKTITAGVRAEMLYLSTAAPEEEE